MTNIERTSAGMQMVLVGCGRPTLAKSITCSDTKGQGLLEFSRAFAFKEKLDALAKALRTRTRLLEPGASLSSFHRRGLQEHASVRNNWRCIALLTVAICVGASGAAAGPLEDADAAIKRRDYATAARIIRPLAEQGDANAQYVLGVYYENGLGVPQDRVKAYMWLSLAASQGRENAASVRDLAAKLMSSAEIEQAQQLAREWKSVTK
jgi:TPR repeat protein